MHAPSEMVSVYVTIVISPELSEPLACPVASGNVLDSGVMVISSGHSIIGGVSSNTVITWSQEEELPQASIAVNVLVLEAEQDVVDIAPSLAVTDAVPQPSEAVAVPRAAVIADEVGLQPSVVTAPVMVITGGF